MRSLLAILLSAGVASSGEPPRFPVPANAEAWKALPNPPLPAWARAVSASLPKTAARMLELDDLHRTSSPLGNALAAKLRFVASDAVGSRYGKAIAEFDAKAAGISKEQLESFADAKNPLAVFARKMALAADSITDSEFKSLLDIHGPETMVGIVHALAYAGFHDRVLLALGVKPEKDPVPPLGRTFEAKWYEAVVTPARDAMPARTAVPASSTATFDWKDLTGKKMPDELATQRKRPLRVPLPSVDKLAFMTEVSRARTLKIVWSHVSQGYQPKMTGAWFAAMNQFQAEAKIDQVFTNTLFWIATRTNRCFY